MNNIYFRIMFDDHVIRYIKSYLVKCSVCNKYDTFIFASNACLTCKKKFCLLCSTNCLIRNYNEYETTSNYCIDCDNENMKNWYRPV